MADKRPEISIIVPAYNVGRFLGECLGSILGQSFGDFEVIVVDDRSPDDSGAIAEAYAARDQRVRVIRKERNEGTMEARRTGYEAARGDYIMFCDGDDTLPPDAFAILHGAISASNSEVVFGDFVVFGGADGERYMTHSRVPVSTRDDVYRALIANKMHMTLWAAIFDSRLFRNEIYSIPGQCVNEDFMVLIQLLRFVREVGFVASSVYRYREQPDSITRRKPALSKLTQEMRANDWCLTFLVSNNIFPAEARRRYIRRVVQSLEAGYSLRQVRNTGLLDTRLFTSRNVMKYCGLRYLLKFRAIALVRSLTPPGRLPK